MRLAGIGNSIFGLGEEPEDETYVVLRSPAQYFAAGYHDSYYWTVLFPDNPSFSYACIYLPSFNREFGFIWRETI